MHPSTTDSEMRLEREKLKDVMKLARESGDKLKNMKEIRRNVLEEQIKPWGVDHPNTIDIRRAVVGILSTPGKFGRL